METEAVGERAPVAEGVDVRVTECEILALADWVAVTVAVADNVGSPLLETDEEMDTDTVGLGE